MTIKVGSIVSHTGGLGWGAGKVLEVSDTSALIQFSDGKNRRIAATHYLSLQPAALHSFVPLPDVPPEIKKSVKPRTAKKKT